MKLVESYIHEGMGYNPFLIRDGWQVAVLNYALEETAEAIEKLDIHHRTDEVFVLLTGDAVLIGADVSDNDIHYDMIRMKRGIVYNIPCDVWHKIAMKPGSSVLIVEKSDTHAGDFEFLHLSPVQKNDLRKRIAETFQE